MARYDGGWVKLWRTAMLGDIGSNLARGGLFAKLICKANLKESIVDWRGQPRTLQRGELVTSLQELARDGGVDIKTISKHLNYLRLRETIEVEKSANGTLIKILNFEEYQGHDAEGSTQGPHAMEHGMDGAMDGGVQHNEERKNKRKKERKNISAFDFDGVFAILSKHVKSEGATARKRFSDQITSAEKQADLIKAATNYVGYLDIETWRHPKTTFATFLGTEKSGYFWHDWINFDLVALKAKAKNYAAEREVDHDAQIEEGWSA